MQVIVVDVVVELPQTPDGDLRLIELRVEG